MKSKNYVITYLSALAIGILLLVYYQQQALYHTIVIVIGALIAIPSLVLLLTMLLRRRPAGQTSGASAIVVATEVASAVGLAFGIWMICSPTFFITAIIYTLGAILILVGVAQVCYVNQAARPLRPAFGWFVVPLLTLIAGVVLIVLGPTRVSACAGLVTGIALVIYAANGFASAGREANRQHHVQKLEDARLRAEASQQRNTDDAR
ncbi:MAG: DUF308 domain-containing protein [Muribaculaceae bacterium]|nr:DUF308 domain-containing protein [Muribaculaceae bacterium]